MRKARIARGRGYLAPHGLAPHGVPVVVVSPGVIETEVPNGVTDPQTFAAYRANKEKIGADKHLHLSLGAREKIGRAHV